MSKAIIITAVLAMGLLWARYGISGEIHDVSARGDVARVEALLDQDPALANSPGAAGRTPLLYALEAGRSDVALLLLSRGADARTRDGKGVTALHLAARKGRDDVVKALLAKAAPLEAKDRDGYTPLWYAIMGEAGKSRDATARLLISSGADQWVAVPGGATPLHAAALTASHELMEILVENAADLYAEGDVMVGEELLAGVTPLGLAAYRGSALGIEIMLSGEGECDLNASDSRGRAPLLLAAQGLTGKAVIEKLIKEGAKPAARDKQGRTALHYAAIAWKTGARGQADKEATVRTLVAAGAPLNQADDNGMTALQLAASAGNDSLVKLLTELGAV
ncbi:MAG TPA: ankyrin repeat domain-containing protein [bacterium]|nr:ankyrin repeat domain-containing protein [bacterium]